MIKKKIKKVLALMCTLVTCLSMSMPVFAEELDPIYDHECEADMDADDVLEVLKPAGCFTQGITDVYKPCKICGELVRVNRIKVAPYGGHDIDYENGAYIQFATCKQEAQIIHYCTRCDGYEIETVPGFAEHEFSHIDITDRVEPHDGMNGSYVENYVCAVCGEVYATETIMIPWTDCEHEFIAYETKDPTCCDKGYIKSKCSKCEQENYESIEATGIHTPGEPVVTWIKQPTCTEAGMCTSIIYCEDCNMQLNGSYAQATSPLGHTWVEVNEEATPDQPGFVGHECSVCHEREGEETYYEEPEAPKPDKKDKKDKDKDKPKKDEKVKPGKEKDKPKVEPVKPDPKKDKIEKDKGKDKPKVEPAKPGKEKVLPPQASPVAKEKVNKPKK